MGDLRSIRVFVLGEAQKPGSYTVSGLSTMTNALFVSGGVKEDRIASQYRSQTQRQAESRPGSLRSAAARRHQRRSAADAGRLVIFIPPIGNTVSGRRRSAAAAIYELKHESTAEQVVALAGGLPADAGCEARTAGENSSLQLARDAQRRSDPARGQHDEDR